ncbi:MAG TPA: MFS transporter [Halomicronema sp.]
MMLLSETEIKTHLTPLKHSSLEASPISHHPNKGTHSISPYRPPSNGSGSHAEPSSHAFESPTSESSLSDNGGTPNGKEPPTEEPPTPTEEGFGPVLKNRNFLALWSGQVFSQLADKVYLVLMIALIATRFQASGQTISSWVSAIMIAFTIPAVLLGSLAGAFVDRWHKKAVLVATNLLRGFLVLSLPVLLWLCDGKQLGALPLGFCAMLVVTFLVSTLTQFFAPAEQSAIPLIVERRQLLAANSLYTTTMMASVIVGFAVGEPLLALADSFLGHLSIGKEIVVGGSYCIAGLLLLVLKTGENITPVSGETPHVFEDIRDGLRYLKANIRVRNALIQLVILFSIFAALAVLAVRMAEVIPGLKASQFGFLMAAGGVGMAAGSTALGYFGSRFSHLQLSLVGSVGMAASLVGLSLFAQQVVPALLLVGLLGAFGAIVGVPMQTTVQADTPEEMRGKVFGLQNNAINIALSLPLALAGVAETFFGLKVVFLGLAVLALGGGVLSWYISRYGNSPTHES